jgi:hypothetical protein
MRATTNPLEAAHDAVARNEWLAAHKLLCEADASGGLNAKDFELVVRVAA